jgi:hypothetical protein
VFVPFDELDSEIARRAAERQALVRANVATRLTEPRLVCTPFSWMSSEVSSVDRVECSFVPFCDARKLSVAAITHDRAILERDLLRSDILQSHRHDLTIVENARSAAAGLNECLRRAKRDIVVLVHHDVYLLPAFETQLEYALRSVEERDPDWGVIGVAGARLRDGILSYHGCLFDGTVPQRWGYPWKLPIEVDTLDELLLVVRRSAQLEFDETIPGFHGYAAQISLAAKRKNLRTYAVLADCEHHSKSSGWTPDEEYIFTHAYVAQRWSEAPYGAMAGPMPDVLPSPFKERVRERYAAASGLG